MTDVLLRRYLVVLGAILTAFYLGRGFLPAAFHLPGSLPLHVAAVVGTLLLLSTLFLPYTKRLRGRPGGERLAHRLHMLLGAAGAMLVLVHASGYLSKAPGLLVGAVVGLVATGVYGRLIATKWRYLEFAGNTAAFSPARPSPERAALARLAAAKAALLPRIAPAEAEATFGVNLGHWLTQPLLAGRYWWLALQEERLVSRLRQAPPSSVYRLQCVWRLLHLVLVVLLVAGVVAHVATVTFFAGYAAGGAEPYWWYLRR